MKLKVLSIFFLLISFNYGQSSFDEVVAYIGDRKITAEEFLQRYEFTPFVQKNIKGNENSLKYQFLFTLAAEKLWALEFENLHLDTAYTARFVAKAFEKMFVRDELYKREIKSKIIITDAELQTGLFRNKVKLYLNFLFSDSEKVIRNLYDLLNQGVDFDLILSARDEAKEQSEPVEIIYGQMDKSIEDSLYTLHIGEYTSPFLTPDGWYIFKLVDKSQNIFDGKDSSDGNYSIVKNIIEERKRRIIYQNYFAEFFGGKKIPANAILLKSLSVKLSAFFSAKKRSHKIEDDAPIHLDAQDVLKIEDAFGEDSLEMSFIDFSEEPMSLKDFVRQLAWEGFQVTKTDIENVFSALNSKVRKIIEHELLAREGYKQKLHLLPEIRQQVQMWRDNYLAQMMKNQFTDTVTVTEKEILKEYSRVYKKEYNPPLINIAEVLTDSLEIVRKVLEKLKQGTPLKSLAMKYSKRKSVKIRGGETGLISIYEYEQIGDIAKDMDIGEVYGPLKLPEGYSIFKLLDKKDAKVVLPQPLEKLRDGIKREIVLEKTAKFINDFTLKLANKYGIEINSELLEKIDVTGINSFAIRTLGFGGSITAVPLIKPDLLWAEQWLKQQKLNP